MKELKMGIKIGEHDFNVRMRAAEKFLTKGHSVKVGVWFKGREVTHPEVGQELMERFCKSLDEISTYEVIKDKNGNRRVLTAILTPKKVAKKG